MGNAAKKPEDERADQENIPTAEIWRPPYGPGSRIDQFEVEREIGRGGMGVVYLARDAKLDRCVAVKSLPRKSMDNPEVRGRFDREAKVLASLNHPNIATIHDIVEDHDGSPFLVLEYVPGQTLGELIANSRLKPGKALAFALQIAEAVSAAHQHNIIHRDLKPGNIKVTAESRIKVLDFGLAKTICAEAVSQSSSVTQPGRIMGTPTYMSPEQARGHGTDKRGDIWSFGCVLYEMLTGKVAFRGETVSDTLAAVLEREPDWQALPKSTPSNIRILLRRCLAKDPQQRLHDIADAVIEISETLSGALDGLVLPGDITEISGFLRREVILAAAVCLIVGVLVAGAIFMGFAKSLVRKPARVSRLPIPIPTDKQIYSGKAPNSFLAISPNGTELVYVGKLDSSDTELYARSLDSLGIRRLNGTKGAHNPFFSPDGRWVGFFAGRQLKKVLLAGGEPLPLLKGIPSAEAAFGSWADDGTIVFSGGYGLRRIPDIGALEAESLMTPNPQLDEANYYFPQVLPGNKAVLYCRVYADASHTSSVQALLLATGKQQDVLKNATYATYVSSGHLIFVRNRVLMAAPFDVDRLKVTGQPTPLVKDDVEFDWTYQTPQISVSTNGTLAYVTASNYEPRKGELVWVDSSGVSTPLATDAEVYEGPRLSPDGLHVAVGIRYQEETNVRVSIYDIQLRRFNPLMTEGEGNYAQWSPDGTRIAFWGRTKKTESTALFCSALGEGDAAELLASKPATGAFLHPYAWSQNIIACTVLDPVTLEDIWIVDLDGGEEPTPVIRTDSREYNPTLSPDGRWLAYVSNKSGQLQIHVQDYPSLEREWMVRTVAATNPVWSRDGRKLYYVSENRMMVASFTPGPRFPIGEPEVVFESPDLVVSGGSLVRNYDVSDDGQFLMVKWRDDTESRLIVVQNWFEELN